MITIPEAPRLIGTPEEKLKELQIFLIQLTETLSIQLNNINLDSFDKETRDKIGGK